MVVPESELLYDRDSGIDIIGRVPWGTHFCQFYDTKQDLIDILVPYFKAGLENNEFCMWVTAEPLHEEEALRALKKVLPAAEEYVRKGQLEIIPHTDWYLKDGTFDQDRVLNGWVEKLDAALAKGYGGLRLTGNTFWLERNAWTDFLQYEAVVDGVIGKYKMIAICTYSLSKCAASDVIDVVNTHQFALIKRAGLWELMQSAGRERARVALRDERERARELAGALSTERDVMRALMENTDAHLAYLDADLNFVMVNETYARGSGHTKEQLIDRNHFDLFPNPENQVIFEKVRDTGEPAEFREKPFEFADQPWRGVTYWDWTLTPVKDLSGQVQAVVLSLVDVTETVRRRKLSEALNEINAAISSTLDFDEIMRRVVVDAAKAIGVESAGVAVRERDAWVVTHVYGLPPEVIGLRFAEESYDRAGPAAQPPRPIVVNDVSKDDRVNRELLESYNVRSMLAIPLSMKDEALRVVFFNYHSEAVPFSEAQVDFATKLAISVSLAIEKTRLFEAETQAKKETRDELEISSLLLKAADTLGLSLDLEHVLGSLAEIVVEATQRSRVMVALADRDTQRLTVSVTRGKPAAAVGESFDLGLLARTRRQGESSVAAAYTLDYNAGDLPADARRLMESFNARFGLLVPLVVSDRELGVMSIDEPGESSEFTPREIGIVEGIASQAAVAIENARLYRERQQTAELSDALNSINAIIHSTVDVQEILRGVGAEAARVLGADSATVAFLEAGEWVVADIYGRQHVRRGARLTDARAPVACLVLKTRKPVAVHDTLTDERFDAKLMRESRMRAVLAVPLMRTLDVVGVLSFNYYSGPVSFSAAKIDFASKLGAAVALATENARLFEVERKIAETLQDSLIKPVPSIEDLAIGVAERSASEAARVGGDFYDIFSLDKGRVAVLVGDVAGKGVEAAGLTETIRSSVRTLTYLEKDPSPGRVLSRVNESMLRQVPPGQFVTAALLVLDVGTEKVRYANAGHPPPIVCGTGCDSLVEILPGLPLGSFRTAYPESCFELAAGQMLVLYTDGLTEARRKTKAFGDERLLKTLSAIEPNIKRDPQQLVDFLLRKVAEFAEGMLVDDIAIVALRVL